MATRTKPLVSAATLASAAAIAVAGTAIAPTLNLPTPHALSAAKVQLATLTDVLSIPGEVWTNVLFYNTPYGGRLSDTSYGAAFAEPQTVFGQPGYVNPWAVYCTNSKGEGTCSNDGISGVAYLFLDALVNGDGLGWANNDQWSVGVPNYLFEPNFVFVVGGGSSPDLQFVDSGWSAASWYILQGTLGQAIPELQVPIAAAFIGEYNVSVFYNLALTVAAGLVSQVPGVGPFVGNSILAYLGDLETPDSDPTDPTFYQYGLSGALNYWINVLNGSEPLSAAATLAAAATPAVAEAAVALPEAPAADTKPAVEVPAEEAPESTPAAEAPESTPAAEVAPAVDESEAPESAPAAEVAPAVDESEASVPDVKDSTPAAEVAPAVDESEASVPDVEDSTPAAEVAPAADESEASVPDVKDSAPAADVADSTPAPAKTAPKRPVRDAVEKVSKQISSAISGAKTAKAGASKAGAADNAS